MISLSHANRKMTYSKVLFVFLLQICVTSSVCAAQTTRKHKVLQCGMTCGGCSTSVQRILENQAQVASATVDLKTDIAVVLPVSEAKPTPNWQKIMDAGKEKVVESFWTIIPLTAGATWKN
ncbi:hypothetical protein LXL04_032007 [Taraxacum kok-saghyz]